jgi:putative phosphoesterase
MRIAVISDTHDAYPRKLPGLLEGADEIWHLGDVMAPHVLVEFEQIGVPLYVVLGNCDYEGSWPETLTLRPEGVVCHLVHIPPRKSPKGVQLLLHGHTHIPRDYTDSVGVRWLNPGSVSNPRGGFPASFAWLELEPGRPPVWQLVRV